MLVLELLFIMSVCDGQGCLLNSCVRDHGVGKGGFRPHSRRFSGSAGRRPDLSQWQEMRLHSYSVGVINPTTLGSYDTLQLQIESITLNRNLTLERNNTDRVL